MNIKHIESEALGLPPEDRARLALELIESLENLAQPEVERLWLQESVRRASQIDAGTAELIPGDVVARETFTPRLALSTSTNTAAFASWK